MTQSRDQKVLFSIAPTEDGTPVLMLLMPEESWHYMHNGLCHEFDLTNIGVPIKLVLGRTETHATGMKMIEQANRQRGLKTKDLRDADVKFGQKAKH